MPCHGWLMRRISRTTTANVTGQRFPSDIAILRHFHFLFSHFFLQPYRISCRSDLEETEKNKICSSRKCIPALPADRGHDFYPQLVTLYACRCRGNCRQRKVGVMAISEEIRKKLYERAGGRCECKSQRCDLHKGRCHQKLSGNWYAHHKADGGSDTLGNLFAMCIPCHQNTRREAFSRNLPKNSHNQEK